MVSRAEALLQGDTEQKEKTNLLRGLLDEIISGNGVDELVNLVNLMVGDGVPLVISRPVLQHFSQEICKVPAKARGQVLRHAIDALMSRNVSFEETDAKLRELLGQSLADSEEYVEAARVLAGINLEGGRYNDSQKAEQYVRITELFLEEDETVEAERYVNRAAQFVHNSLDPLVQVRHKVSYARILDSKRKFLEASQRYYQLSVDGLDVGGSFVAEEDLLHLLTKSMTCAILASAGPQRTRTLSLLYKDERCKQFPVHFSVLEKMYKERLLMSSEVSAFDETLKPHQKALLADGSSVLERAVVEHNMRAASLLYSSASFEELGKLLGIDAPNAIQIAAAMIQEGRMTAEIDQVSGFVYFQSPDSASLAFDKRIQDLCIDVSKTLEVVATRYPKFAVQNI